MAIRSVVVRGFGNGTFNGTIALVTLRGYKSASESPFEEALSVPFAPGQFLTIPDERYHSTVQSEALYSTCILQTETQLQDGQGGYTEAYTNSYIGVPCRLMMSRGVGGAIRNGISTDERAILTLLASQEVSADMRVWVDGVIYEVVRVHKPGTFTTTRRVVVRRVS